MLASLMIVPVKPKGYLLRDYGIGCGANEGTLDCVLGVVEGLLSLV